MAAAALDVNTMQPRSFFCTCTAVDSLYQHLLSSSLLTQPLHKTANLFRAALRPAVHDGRSEGISQGGSFSLHSNWP